MSLLYKSYAQTLDRARCSLLLLAIILGLLGSIRVSAQGGSTPGTVPVEVQGLVYLAEVDQSGNLTPNLTTRSGITVRVYPGRHQPAVTGPDGKFTITLFRTGNFNLTAKLSGYQQYASKPVWVSNEKPRMEVEPPPIHLVRSAQARIRQEQSIILVLYRSEDSGRRPAVPWGKATLHQGELSLSGRVISRDKQPINGASVSVLVLKGDSERHDTLAETKTNSRGDYALTVNGLDAYDEYVLSVKMSGFNDFVALLDKGESPPRILELDEATFAEDPLLERTEATRRHVFSSQVLETLPVGGLRNFDTFALLAPGVAPPPETPNAPGPGVSAGLGTAGQFSVNGLRSRENNFTVDGSDNNDEDIGTRRQGFVALAPQSLESISEFQIITALGDARFGRNIGGQVNALTKSGSPEFHGALYGLLTDSRLNSRDFFDGTQSNGPSSFALTRQSDGAPVLLDGRPIVTPNPVGGENPLTRTQLGLVGSGLVPKLDDPFFVSLERLKLRASRESHFIVPTVEQRGLFDSGATGLLLDGPVPDVPNFPSTINGNAIFSLYPFPNNPLGPFARNTYTTVLPADAEATRLSAKLEHRFGESNLKQGRRPWSFFSGGDTLTGRYNLSQETSTVPVTGQALFSSMRPNVRTQNIAFYLNRLLTSRISDVIRFSVGRTRLTFAEVRDPSLPLSARFPKQPFLLNAPLLLNVTAPLSNGTLTSPSFVSASSPQGAALLHSFPGVTQTEGITGPLGQLIMPSFSPIGVDVYHFPQERANTVVQVADTVTYAHPKGHIFNFGVDVRKMLINSTLDRNFRPLLVFGGFRTPESPFGAQLPGGPPLFPTAFSDATLAAAGVPAGHFQTLAVSANSTVGIRFTQASLFAQSDWRARPDVNINLGARFNYLGRLQSEGKKLETAFSLEQLNKQGQGAVADCVRQGSQAECEAFVKCHCLSLPGRLRYFLSR